MDPRGLRVTMNAYLSFFLHTKKLLLVTFCNITAGIRRGTTGQDAVWTDRHEG